MARGGRGCRSKQDGRHNDQHSSDDYDRISMLPDEVLVCILSFLTLKEAIATSILSRRWRYVWTCIPRLDFDGFESLLNVDLAQGNRVLLLDQERRNYVEWVNHVITLHKLSNIEEFRVFYNLNKTHKDSIDEWLRYALSRKVQKLELNLTDDASRRIRRDHEYYTFPYELLRLGEGSLIDFKCLKKVSLRYVNVTHEAMQFFLSNCPLLEDVSVCRSLELMSLSITGPLPLLKRLEITLCHNLNSVEIRDAGLVYLKYIGPKIHFLMENVPLLVDLFIGGMLTDNMEDVLLLFSSYLPQLEIFTMQRLGEPSWTETELFYSVVKMSNLKIFELRVDVLYNHSLLPLTKLLSASPCLERFVLEVLRSNPDFDEKNTQKVVSSYSHLKEFMFVGYYGMMSDLEFVMHFVENAVALETVVVDPCEPCESTYHYVYRYKSELKGEIIEKEINARARAKKQLTKFMPPSINLHIL